ncbi:MAG: bile acid:sodium symporter [Oceanospirillaceae bacterium]
MKTYFLPVGLFLSLLISLLIPEPGVFLKDLGLIPWCVVIIFFVNGYQTELKELPTDSSFVYTLLATSFICLIISPLLGLLTASLLQLSLGLTLGLLVKSAVPSTLSTCIVMTSLAGGRATWALMMTVIINIVGVFSIPFMLDITASENIDFAIDPLALLQKLVILVLCPFIAGFLFKKLDMFSPKHPFLTYLPSSMVIMAVWLSLSASAAILYDISLLALAKIALAAIIVHFGLMLIAMLTAKFLPIDNGARVAMALTASQKTLPVAVSILASFNQNVGDAVLFCVLFHFIQLFADAALLPKLKKYYQL